MATVIGLAVAAWLVWLWLAGKPLGRIAMFLAVAVLGFFLAVAGVKPGESPEPRYPIVLAVAYALASAPVWLRRGRRKLVDVRVKRARNVPLQLVLTDDRINRTVYQGATWHA